jgi:hypothetical protein
VPTRMTRPTHGAWTLNVVASAIANTVPGTPHGSASSPSSTGPDRTRARRLSTATTSASASAPHGGDRGHPETGDQRRQPGRVGHHCAVVHQANTPAAASPSSTDPRGTKDTSSSVARGSVNASPSVHPTTVAGQAGQPTPPGSRAPARLPCELPSHRPLPRSSAAGRVPRSPPGAAPPSPPSPAGRRRSVWWR